MSDFEDALLHEAGGRSRVPLDGLWRAYQSAEPVRSAASGKRDSLRTALDALERRGVLRTPRSPKLWDRSATPAVPRWVQLTAQRTTPTTPAGPVAWAPELEFARSISHPAQRAVLEAVQRFLAAGGRDRPRVPMRERSLEVFGDEKRLDHLLRGTLFQSGRLDLALLRCFAVSPPLVWQGYDAASTTALIIENHHTFHSFKRWNQEHLAYRVVAYGAGKAVCKAIESFSDAAQALEINAIEYFGDLDREGLSIATKLRAVAKARGLPPVVPAERWYRLLVDRGDQIAPIEDPGGSLDGAALSWFAPPLREEIQERCRGGRRLPQELVGWEALMGLTRKDGARP